eukprot:scaffold18408_cov61-Phaeocystis_antarctica.AAC.2
MTAAHAAWRRGLDKGQGTRGGAHLEHVAHVFDFGGVEAQPLVERRRALPRVARRAYGAGRGAGREAAGRRAGTLRAGHTGRRRAHLEHLVHVCDAGGVEAQRLVERRRVLPRVARRAYGAGRGAGREAAGRRATAGHVACRGGLDYRLRAGHTGRSARVEAQRLVKHRRVLPRVESRACGAGRGIRVGGQQAVDDRGGTQRAGEGATADRGQGTGRSARVEAQRLVERPRILPRVERRACGAGRGVAREAGGSGQLRRHAACRGGRGCRLGAGHGEERTRNMSCIVVTLEVSKLSGCADRRREVARATAAHAACGGGRGCRLGAGHGEERTPNIWCMVVTLEVSRLSGWLNTVAYCRESKEGLTVRREVYGSGGSRRWTTAAHAACRRGRDCRLVAGRGEERTENM